MGGEITYKYVAGNQYQVTYTIYRDCSGIAAGTTETINVSSASTSSNFTATLTATLPFPQTTEICSAQALNTLCDNGFLPGYQKIAYTGIVNLPVSAADWKFSATICCRNGAITNLPDPLNLSFWVESTLNNLNGPNNSPAFATQPVIIIQANSTHSLSWNAFDADGDLLEYRLTEPLQGNNQPITADTGFSPQEPFLHFAPTQFDSLTGVMTVHPSGQQVPVVSMIITEKRQGLVIGTVRRDLQIIVRAGTDAPPSVSGFNNTSLYEMDVAVDSLLAFSLQSNDADTSQQLSVLFDSSLTALGAAYAVTGGLHPSANVSWTPHANDMQRSPVYFTVVVRDDFCPYNSIQSYTYRINILSAMQPVVYLPPYAASCNGSPVALTPFVTGGTGPYTYHWSPAAGLNDSSTANPVASPTVTTTYFLTVTDAAQVTVTDSIVVLAASLPVVDSLYIEDAFCTNNFGAACVYASGGTPPYHYGWNNLFNPVFTSCDTSVPTGNAMVTVIDSNGCRVDSAFIIGTTSSISAFFTLHPDPNTPHNWFAVNQSTTISGTADYDWDWGDGTSSSGQFPSHTYSAPGYYNICLGISEASFLCYSNYCDSSTYVYKNEQAIITVNVVSQLPTGIQNEVAYLPVSIYPTPARDLLFINAGNIPIRLVRIYNSVGHLLGEMSAPLNGQLDVSAYPAGIYLAEISAGNAKARVRWIKM